MYKIMIVDDEDDARRAIAQAVDWEHEGFELTGEARNGREALSMIEVMPPDAIITDINMPYTNGLELLRSIRDSHLSIRVILLTAYDEFEFAQSAIRSQAVDYILKPITKEELLLVLRALKAGMDIEAAERENIDKLRQEYEASLPILREKFLSGLLSSYAENTVMEEKAWRYGLDILDKTIMIGIISVDTMREGTDEGFGDEGSRGELARFAMFNIADEVMKSCEAGMAFMHDRHVVLFGTGGNGAVDGCLKVFDEVRCCIDRYLKFAVTIGAGTPALRLCDVHTSYKSAVEAADYKILMGGGKVIYIRDIEPLHSANVRFTEEVEQKLSTLVRVGAVQDVDGVVDTLFAGLLFHKISDYDVYVIEMVLTVLKAAGSAGVDTAILLGEKDKLFGKILHAPDISAACGEVKLICKKVIAELAHARANTAQKLIRDALDYVSAHYMDSEVSNEQVCRHLHVSQSYFCAIFKKEMGDTFNNYLTAKRMEMAKRYLCSGNMKMREIAARVGYTDPNYFSFNFKKLFGLSPREYQIQHGR